MLIQPDSTSTNLEEISDPIVIVAGVNKPWRRVFAMMAKWSAAFPGPRIGTGGTRLFLRLLLANSAAELPKLLVGRDLAFRHWLRALAIKVGLPALIQHRTIAGTIGQIVAIPHSIERIVKIEAVFIRLDGDGIEILAGGKNQSRNI